MRRATLPCFVIACVIAATLPAAAAEAEAPPAATTAVEVGEEAPEFTLRSIDGTEHRLADRRGKGPVVLIFFRGTW